MLAAIVAHERVHESRLQPALQDAAPFIEKDVESNPGLVVPDQQGMTAADAVRIMQGSAAFAATRIAALKEWDDFYKIRIFPDHGANCNGPAHVAQQAVIKKMIDDICAHRRAQGWGPCQYCPNP
jgi:hypothetical protein